MGAAAAALTAVAVAGSAPTAGARHLTDPPPPRASSLIQASSVTRVSSVIQRLSNTQLAGQRVIYSYPGLNPPAALLRAIHRGEAAGVIFFAGNISSPAQLAAVSRQLQRDRGARTPTCAR